MKRFGHFLLVLAILGSLALSFQNCQKNSDSAPDSSEPSIFGRWYYDEPISTNEEFGVIIDINSTGNITIMQIYAQLNGNHAKVLFRKKEGVFKKQNDELIIDYSHSTCDSKMNNILKYHLSGANLRLSSKDESEILVLRKHVSDQNVSITASASEDKECNWGISE